MKKTQISSLRMRYIVYITMTPSRQSRVCFDEPARRGYISPILINISSVFVRTGSW